MESFFQFAETTLSLTRADILMIPIGAFLFAFFWRGMDRYLFSPFLELVEAREGATTGAVSGAQELIREAEQLEVEYDARLMEERVKLVQEKLKSLTGAQAEADAIVGAKHKEIAEEAVRFQEQITREAQQLRSRLLEGAGELAVQLVNQLLAPAQGGNRASQ